MELAPLTRGWAREVHSDGIAEVVSATRAVLGACNWLAKEGRPDASAVASLISGAVTALIAKYIRDLIVGCG